jgi:hypothetical protein
MNKDRTMKRIRNLLLGASLALATITPTFAADPSGNLTFSGGSIAAGIGFTWGSGVLHFAGHDYPFSVHGLSVADVGLAGIDGAGDVYNLQHVEDFAGSYAAAAAGVTVGEGAGFATLENPKGVRIYLHSTTKGLKINLSADGINITLN